MQQTYYAIGLMSGTSLDGLDICYCQFNRKDEAWNFEILLTENIPYDEKWVRDFSNRENFNDQSILALEEQFTNLQIDSVQKFIQEHSIEKLDFIASHGHTMAHDPDNGITVQIGDGERMAKDLDHCVVNDFRLLDVKLGGQGAPLVPVGDKLLFREYDACLNLGGIANISFDQNHQRIAFDICPANLPLNKFMLEEAGKTYDENGVKAESGEFNCDLLGRMNHLGFYKTEGPKSLGVEWLDENFYPLVAEYPKLGLEDKLRTVVEHETRQIAEICNSNGLKKILVTGGGAHNTFFMKRLAQKVNGELVIPDNEIIDYKEALVFAFLGLLKIRGEINTYASVTGAREDSSGGEIWNP